MKRSHSAAAVHMPPPRLRRRPAAAQQRAVLRGAMHFLVELTLLPVQHLTRFLVEFHNFWGVKKVVSVSKH